MPPPPSSPPMYARTTLVAAPDSQSAERRWRVSAPTPPSPPPPRSPHASPPPRGAWAPLRPWQAHGACLRPSWTACLCREYARDYVVRYALGARGPPPCRACALSHLRQRGAKGQGLTCPWNDSGSKHDAMPHPRGSTVCAHRTIGGKWLLQAQGAAVRLDGAHPEGSYPEW